MDLQAIRNNTALVRGLLAPDCQLMAVAKADAYGHGALRLAEEWGRCGVEHFCVASLGEAVQLRQAGISGDILILGYTAPAEAEWLARYDLIQTIVDAEHGRALAAAGIPLRAHIKVDTGMHRLGVDCDDTGEVLALLGLPGLAVEGVFTHFYAADETSPDAVAATRAQAERFAALMGRLAAHGVRGLATHMQSSYGIFNYPGLRCDWARAGLALYGGLEPERLMLGRAPGLQPALTIGARVEHVCRVGPGEGVGYGPAWRPDTERRVATLSIGYGDGIPRALGEGAGRVLVRGKSAPIVGLVCMDRLHIDVTEVEGVRQGDAALLLGRWGGEEITVGEVARRAGTIPNEIFSRLGPRLERVYRDGAPTAAPARRAPAGRAK